MQRVALALLSLLLLSSVPIRLAAQQGTERLVLLAQRYPDRFGPITQRLRAQYRDMDTTLFAVLHAYSYPAR